MANKTTYIKVRTTPELKADVQAILSELGISLSDTINLFLTAVKRKRGIPFKTNLPKWYLQYHNAPVSKNIPKVAVIKKLKNIKKGEKMVEKYKDLNQFFDSLGLPRA